MSVTELIELLQTYEKAMPGRNVQLLVTYDEWDMDGRTAEVQKLVSVRAFRHGSEAIIIAEDVA